MKLIALFFLLLYCSTSIDASHFRGGIISWRALNTTPSGSTAQFLIYERYSWRKSANAATNCPTLGGIMAVTGYPLACFYGSCSGWPTTFSTDVYCTDYDATTDYSSGERYYTVTLTLGTSRSIGFYDSAWLALAYSLGSGSWSVMNLLNAYVRPDGVINTSPVTTTLPVIYKTVNTRQVHVIQMADADSTDTLRCRWAVGGPSTGSPVTAAAAINNTVQHIDECGSAGVCQPAIPGAVLIGSNCTLVFNLSSSQTGQYYAVALQIEDFYNSTTTTPMSSVPVQFLFYAVAAPSNCSIRPMIIGARPNRACIGQPINSVVSENVIAQPGCAWAHIVRFTSSSPTGLTQSAIVYNSLANTYTTTLSWVPTSGQAGPQGFCAAAVDSLNQQSDQWCITFVVGAVSPNLNTPIMVQGSASPLGTVFANQSLFSIQATQSVNRPSLNGTNVYFNDAAINSSANATVLQYDAGYASNIIYTGNTILILVQNFTWTYGHTYYITMDEGFSSGTEFCGPESAAIADPAYWRFNIWDPGLSSTTSTTTTPPTTHTVTSLGPSTTTPNTAQTTTGIIITTTNSSVSTTIITTTTTVTMTTTTSVTTVPTTTLLTDVPVMSAKEYETACQQPVAIMTAVTMLTMLPINAVGMFTLFTKMNQMFNPHRIAAKLRQGQFASRHANRK